MLINLLIAALLSVVKYTNLTSLFLLYFSRLASAIALPNPIQDAHSVFPYTYTTIFQARISDPTGLSSIVGA